MIYAACNESNQALYKIFDNFSYSNIFGMLGHFFFAIRLLYSSKITQRTRSIITDLEQGFVKFNIVWGSLADFRLVLVGHITNN